MSFAYNPLLVLVIVAAFNANDASDDDEDETDDSNDVPVILIPPAATFDNDRLRSIDAL